MRQNVDQMQQLRFHLISNFLSFFCSTQLESNKRLFKGNLLYTVVHKKQDTKLKQIKVWRDL